MPFFSRRQKFNDNGGNIEYIIAGLGNPGKKYESTRHNVGFLALDMISEKYNIRISRIKFKSVCGEGKIGDKRVLLLKPQTFMNNSGEALREAMSFYKITPDKCIIILDDISLEPGIIRIKQKSSDGGQKGMKSIIYLTGSDEYPRIKMGIGKKPHPDYELADWVLSKITKNEIPAIKTALENSVAAAQLIVDGKIDEAMNKFN